MSRFPQWSIVPTCSCSFVRIAAAAAAWLAVHCLAALTLGAPPARAEVLVSNMDQAPAPLERVDYGKREYAEGRITITIDRAYVPYASQRFRTGLSAGGYTLEEFRMNILSIEPSSAAMTVALFTDAAGKPGSLLAVLHPEGGFTTGTMRFRARRQSGAYPHLEPDTYYHMEFQKRLGRLYWSITESDLEEGANGWSLDNNALSFISGSNHDETLSGVGILYEMSKGEYGDASEWSPGFGVVPGWNEFPRAFRIEILGSTVADSAPELAATYSRSMAENPAPGTAVGDPVTASDADGDPISYALAGPDGGVFAIDAGSGQIRTKEDVFYDYEIRNSYTVTVIADDGNGNTDTAVATITLTDVAEVLTASIEAAPEEHNGLPFVVELAFSEPAGVRWTTVRDSLLSVTNGQVTRARRLDLARGLKKMTDSRLSARWEVTIEPAGGDVTVMLPATTSCSAAGAVCTTDGRRLLAAVTETVPQGTLPALTASFAGAPEQHHGPAGHDGRSAFTLELNFNAAVATSRQVMRTRALRVTNGRVTKASNPIGRSDRWLLTVEPSSLQDVSVALEAPASCDDTGAVCSVDGRRLSSGAEVRVTGPASIPLTGEGGKHLPMHAGSPFTFGLTFSWAVKITPKAMEEHALRVTNGEIINATRMRDDSGRWWHIRVLPWSTDTVTVDLPVTTDCAAAGAVCTRDGRMLSRADKWVFLPMDPDAVDETAPGLRRAEVDGATLMLMYYEGLDEASTPAADAFTVTVAGAPRSLSSSDPVSVSGRTVTLTLASALTDGETVTLSYAVPSSNPLRDMAGNDAGALSEQAVRNRTAEPNTSAPTLQAAAANSDYVMLTYNEVLDEASTPAADAFTVTVAGAARDLAPSDPVSVSGRTVTLTLASALTDGETVTVSYTVPSSNPLQDPAGNDAVALSEQAASNRPSGSASSQQDAADALTAEFRELPTSHGMELFTFELWFSEAFEVSYRTLRNKAFSVMNGRVTKAKRVNRGSNRRWRITVDPDGGGNVVVTLPAMQDCEAMGAICTDDDRPLADSPMAVVPETPPVVTEDPPAEPAVDPDGPLTVKFEEGSLPETHDGRNPIVFRIAFSHEPKSDYGYMTLRQQTLQMRLAGRVIVAMGARKLEPPSRKRWQIMVSTMPGSPGYDDVSDADLTLAIGPTLDCEDKGAVCTEDGRKLSNRISATILGLPALSVANAHVEEAVGATVDFTVSLSRAASATVTVNYATEDSPSGRTAQPGSDYTSTSGTLTFDPGQTSKTVSVAVIEDAENEGDETFRLTLSNFSGDSAWLDDRIAVGTIVDAEPEEQPSEQQQAVPQNLEPLEAEFLQLPADHDGSTAFTFEVKFSEDIPSLGYQALRDSVFEVTGGNVTGVSRVHRNGDEPNRHWNIIVQPAGNGDVEIRLPATEDCVAGYICTSDDRPLSQSVSATVPGPPGLSVGDAGVAEAENATVDFTVTLSRTVAEAVSVNYATSDVTAMAGEDYTATSGTLTFTAGETAKTVSVPVLDDVIDEGHETFTLTLSNAAGGNAWLSGASATGTIMNTDPLPRAWLARFGRTVATHVLDAVEERLDGGSGDSWVRLGGHHIGGVTEDVMASARRLAPERRLWDEVSAADPGGQDMTLDQLLMGSAFHLVSNAEAGSFGPRLTAWGRVASSGFDGDEDRMTLEGTVTTATLGVDGVFRRWLTGVALAYSAGDGSFTQTEAPSGDITSTLTSVHPYVGYALSDRVKVWGMVGYGSGALELVLADRDPLRTDLDMTMGALGVRGTVLSTAAGLELAIRSDVLWVNTGSAATPGMVSTDADTNRLRLVLEGSRPFSVGAGGLLTPTLELGVRRDGGDAEEGAGVEVGGRLLYASSSGLSIEASLRALVAHEASDYREWGASGALRYDPGRQGLGLTASITPTWGMAASGVGRLWSQPDARGLAGAPGVSPTPPARVDAELGYGLRAMNGQGVLTPYARASLVEGSEHAWHLGTRLALAESLSLSLEATHRQRPDAVSAQELALLATVPW